LKAPSGCVPPSAKCFASQHRAAIIEPKSLGGLLRAIETYEGAPEPVSGRVVLFGTVLLHPIADGAKQLRPI
jgi:hypothetical protein